METKRGTVAHFRELIHPQRDGAMSRYESVFEVGGQAVRLLWYEPALINNGDDVEVTGKLDRQYLLARSYTNHTRSVQGNGLKWVTANQRLLWTLFGLVVVLVLLLGSCIAIGLLVPAGS